jgi:hypothetical protein
VFHKYGIIKLICPLARKAWLSFSKHVGRNELLVSISTSVALHMQGNQFNLL